MATANFSFGADRVSLGFCPLCSNALVGSSDAHRCPRCDVAWFLKKIGGRLSIQPSRPLGDEEAAKLTPIDEPASRRKRTTKAS